MEPVAYRHPEPHDDFSVRLHADGTWRAWWRDEDLGENVSAQAAVEDLASGTTQWPSCGNPGTLGLSDDLSDWLASSA